MVDSRQQVNGEAGFSQRARFSVGVRARLGLCLSRRRSATVPVVVLVVGGPPTGPRQAVKAEAAKRVARDSASLTWEVCQCCAFFLPYKAILRRGRKLQLSSSLIFRIQMAPSANSAGQAAAQRLGLAAGEHGAKLTPIRTAFAPTVRSRACHVREAGFEPDITIRATVALHAQALRPDAGPARLPSTAEGQAAGLTGPIRNRCSDARTPDRRSSD